MISNLLGLIIVYHSVSKIITTITFVNLTRTCFNFGYKTCIFTWNMIKIPFKNKKHLLNNK